MQCRLDLAQDPGLLSARAAASAGVPLAFSHSDRAAWRCAAAITSVWSPSSSSSCIRSGHWPSWDTAFTPEQPQGTAARLARPPRDPHPVTTVPAQAAWHGFSPGWADRGRRAGYPVRSGISTALFPERTGTHAPHARRPAPVPGSIVAGASARCRPTAPGRLEVHRARRRAQISRHHTAGRLGARAAGHARSVNHSERGPSG
jgi:hypothetical protein